VLLGCVTALAPSTALSKTREIIVPELDGKVLISGIQYAGNSVELSDTKNISVKNKDEKRIAVFSIQLQNAKKINHMSWLLLFYEMRRFMDR
jgi:ABC-type uncharacterized transport system substrate-binding protein